jgi:hypothetical protein
MCFGQLCGHLQGWKIQIIKKYITEHKIKWPHGWPKHIGGHSVYTLISMHLCACVGTTIIYIYKLAHYSLTFKNETV